MRKMVAALSLFIVTLFASAIASAQDNPVVVMETNKGTIKIEAGKIKRHYQRRTFCVM